MSKSVISRVKFILNNLRYLSAKPLFAYMEFNYKKISIILFATTYLLLCSNGCIQNTYKKVAIKNGIMNLSNWQPENEGEIILDGKWSFYWNKLIGPDNFNWDMIHDTFYVPGLWNNYKKNKNFWAGDGYATLSLKLTNISDLSKDYYLFIPEIPTSSKLWINGKLKYTEGVVGKTKASYTPFINSKIIRVQPTNSGEIKIILQAANFTHKDGGIWSSFKLGLYKDIIQHRELPSYFDMCIFGILFIMGLYHIGLFALMPKDKASLYFGLFCLLIAGRSLMVGQRIFFKLMEIPSWIIRQDIEYACFFLSAPAFILFFYYLFPGALDKKFCRLFTAVSSLFVSLTIFAPLKLITYSGNFFQAIVLSAAFYILFITFRLVKQKQEGSRLFLYGYLMLLVTIINDLLYSHLVIQTRSLIHFGVFLFILCQALILSRKNAVNLQKVETVSKELENKNIELTKINKLKDDFLANTSHELKTPLHGIMGLSDALLDDPESPLSPHQKNTLQMISGSGKRLFNLINDLLDFSSIQRNKLKLNKKPVAIEDTIKEVIAFIEPMTKGKPVEIRLSIPENIPPVFCDENRIQQVLFNLLENSVKYTATGAIEIIVELINKNIKISVKDTGIGIEREKLSSIFRAFEQGYDSETHYFQGVGLGLSICEEVIKLHNSELFVESVPGEGTSFSFNLQIADKAPAIQSIHKINPRRFYNHSTDSQESEYKLEKENANSKIKKNILIVDDEPVNIEIVNRVLFSKGYNTLTAHSGDEALEIISNELPDLVLLDIMMPGIDGYEVCMELRKNFSQIELPVILLTAKNRIDDMVKGFQYGANDYIPKPFFKEELVARINNLLDAKEAVKLMKNNIFLKKEIGRRKEVEEKLRTIQRKMLRIIDASSDTIIAINQDGNILFFNQQAERHLEYMTGEVLNQPAEMILGNNENKKIKKILQEISEPSQSTSIRKHETFEFKKGDGSSLIKNVEISAFVISSAPMAAIIFNASTKESQYKSIDFALNSLPELIKPYSNGLRDISPELDSVQDALPPYSKTSRSMIKNENDLREAITDLMVKSVTLWEISGKSKIDLAEESGLWKAYLDRGTYKTRTLDKYLSLKTLPKKPRWREVIKTAYFVILNTSLTKDEEIKLKQLIELVENNIKKRT